MKKCIITDDSSAATGSCIKYKRKNYIPDKMSNASSTLRRSVLFSLYRIKERGLPSLLC
jgi:hypothetical protein